MLLVVASLLTASHISFAIFMSLIFAPTCVEVVDRMKWCMKHGCFSRSMIHVSLTSICSSDAGVLPSDKIEIPFDGLGTIAAPSTCLHNLLDPITF